MRFDPLDGMPDFNAQRAAKVEEGLLDNAKCLSAETLEVVFDLGCSVFKLGLHFFGRVRDGLHCGVDSFGNTFRRLASGGRERGKKAHCRGWLAAGGRVEGWRGLAKERVLELSERRGGKCRRSTLLRDSGLSSVERCSSSEKGSGESSSGWFLCTCEVGCKVPS